MEQSTDKIFRENIYTTYKRKENSTISIVFYSAKIIIEITSFTLVCILVNLSKNNPFEEHFIGNLNNYFNDSETNIIFNRTNITKYNNKLLINKFSIKNLLNKSENSFVDIKIKISKYRKLVSESFCFEIRDKFEKYKGKKLSSIFDVNYDIIHLYSIINLIISLILVGSLIIFGIFSIFEYNKKNCCKKAIYYITCVIFILSLIGRLSSSFYLFYFMENGDLKEYNRFLECKNVKVKYFENFSDIKKLRIVFYFFITINVWDLAIQQIEKILEYAKKVKELK